MSVFLVTGRKLDATLAYEGAFHGKEAVIALYDAVDEEDAKKKAVQDYAGLIMNEINVYKLKEIE